MKGGRRLSKAGRAAGVPSLNWEGPCGVLGWRRLGAAGNPPFVSEGDGPVLKHGPRSAGRMQGERILSLCTAMNVIIRG